MTISRRPVGIDRDVAFAPDDLLGPVESARAGRYWRLDCLAVDDSGIGIGIATGSFAVDHQGDIVDHAE